MARVRLFRNGIFALLALLVCLPAHPQAVTNPLNGNINAQGTSCVGASCAWQKLPPGAGTSSVTLSGIFSATLQFEISADNGNTWVAASTASSTSTGVTTFSVAGYTDVRVRCSAYVSGVVSATIFSSTSSSSSSGAGGTVTLSASAAVANATYVTTSDVLWTQYTSENLFGSGADVQSTVRILKADGTITNVQWETNPCTSTVSGGVGTGQLSPVNGWITSWTSYVITSGFPQSSILVNHYLLIGMPAGGGPTVCTGTLAKSNIGTMLTSAVTGSSLPVMYPNQNANSWSAPPYTFGLALGNPSAGAEFSTTLSTAGRTCINGMSFTYTTSATAGNRIVGIRVILGSAQLFYVATVPQGPSTTVLYSFSPGTVAQQQTLGVGATIVQTVPFANGTQACMNSGISGSVGSLTGNIQTGDQYGSINISEGLLNDNN